MKIESSDESKALSSLRSAGALQSRRDFLATAVAAPVLLSALQDIKAAGEVITFKSPNSKLQFALVTTGPELQYRILRSNRAVVEISQFAFIVDGINLCCDSTITGIERHRINEKYSTRGVHSLAVNSCLGAPISIRHSPTSADYVLEVRVFDDGIGFRFNIAGEGQRTPDEATTFTFPEGSTVWFHDFEGHYEGIHQKKLIANVKGGEWAAPPLTSGCPHGAVMRRLPKRL